MSRPIELDGEATGAINRMELPFINKFHAIYAAIDILFLCFVFCSFVAQVY